MAALTFVGGCYFLYTAEGPAGQPSFMILSLTAMQIVTGWMCVLTPLWVGVGAFYITRGLRSG